MVTKPKVVRFSPDMEKIIDMIREKFGLMSFAEAVRFCIADAKQSHFPDYVMVQKERLKKTELTPEERAKQKITNKEIEKKVAVEDRIERGRRIGELLMGEEFDINGVPHLRYKVYTQINNHYVDISQVEIGMSEVTEKLLDTQYRGMKGESGEVAKEIINVILNSKQNE